MTAQHATMEGFDLSALKTAGDEPGGSEFAKLRERIAQLEQATARDAAGATAGDVTATVTPRRRRKTGERSTRPMTTLSSNAPLFADLVVKATALGADKGNGKDSQAKFALMVVDAAYLGSLDLDPNKHGTDKRDGIVLAEAYVKGQTGATIFDAKTDSSRKLVSNLDKCIKIGSCPKWGAGQPIQNINDLMTFRQGERKAGKKVDDAFNMLMRYFTQQLRKDTLITGDDLKQFAYKRVTDPRDAEDILDSVRKTLNNLKAGKVANCPDVDTSEEVSKAINLISKRLVNIAKAKGGQTGGQTTNTAPVASASAAA